MDTSNRIPPVLPSTRRADGRLDAPSYLVLEGEIRPLSETICLTRVNGQAIAFQRSCPHEGADLAGATVLGDQIVCPWHGLRMNISDGTSGCRSMRALASADCVEVDGAILVTASADRPAHAGADA